MRAATPFAHSLSFSLSLVLFAGRIKNPFQYAERMNEPTRTSRNEIARKILHTVALLFWNAWQWQTFQIEMKVEEEKKEKMCESGSRRVHSNGVFSVHGIHCKISAKRANCRWWASTSKDMALRLLSYRINGRCAFKQSTTTLAIWLWINGPS